MKIFQKIEALQENHLSEWAKTRKEVDEELSNKQSMFCVCGKLATGLHERNCKRFNNMVNALTVKKLEHLIN